MGMQVERAADGILPKARRVLPGEGCGDTGERRLSLDQALRQAARGGLERSGAEFGMRTAGRPVMGASRRGAIAHEEGQGFAQRWSAQEGCARG
jgi:hypothetical protein